MIDVQICQQVDAQAWNRRITQVAQGGWRQTTWYGDFKAQWKEKALCFIARDEQGGIVGQLLAIYGSPWGWALERRPLASVTQPIARWLAPHIYWHEGPLVFVKKDADIVRRALLQAVADEASARRCLLVDGQPSHFAIDDSTEHGAICDAARDMGWTVVARSTLVVDLGKDLDSLWSNISKEARTKVRKARKQGIEIKALDGDEKYLSLAYGVVVETAERNGVSPLAYADFLRSYHYHSQLGAERSYLSLHEGAPLSFQKVICFNGNALLGGVAYSDHSRNERLYGNDLMQWHIIEEGREAGWNRLDFGGAEPESDDLKMQGIYRFKAKWGGELVACDRLRLTRGGNDRLRWLIPEKLHYLVRGGRI